MQRRIADIVTRFRVVGLNLVRQGVQGVVSTVRGADRIINRLGSGLRISIFTSATYSVRKLTIALKAAGRAGLAAGKTIAAGIGKAGKLAVGGALKVGGLAAAKSAASLTGRALFVGKAAEDTREDLRLLRQMSSLLRISTSRMSEFQLYAEKTGIDMSDLSQIVSGFAGAIADADDPTTEIGRTFGRLGVQTKDAQGRVRSMIDILFDLAQATRTLDPITRAGILNPIFGDDDSLKVSELLDKMAKDQIPGIRKEFADFRADGKVVTAEDVAQTKNYERALLGLKRTWLVFKREVFNAFEPIISVYLNAISRWFNSANRNFAIDRLFVKPFNKLMVLAKDFAKVFLGVDVAVAQIGRRFAVVAGRMGQKAQIKSGLAYDILRGGDVKFKWMVPLQQGLSGVLAIAKGIGLVFAQIGGAAASAVAALNEGFARTSAGNGKTILDKLADIKPQAIVAAFARMSQSVAAFGRDIRRLAAVPMIDPTEIETSLGRGLLLAGVKIQASMETIVRPLEARFDRLEAKVTATMTAIRDSIVGSWTEADAALQSGTGLQAVESSLGQVLYLAGYAFQYLTGIITAIQDFRNGQPVDADFAWVQTLIEGVDYAWDSLKQLEGILKPFKEGLDKSAKAVFGLNGIVLYFILGALAKFILTLIDVGRKLVELYTIVASSAFVSAFTTAFNSARAAGQTFFAAMRAGTAAMWAAMAASAAPFLAVLGVIAATLSTIIAAIAIVKTYQQWRATGDWEKFSADYDAAERRQGAVELQNAMNNQNGGMVGFRPEQIEYIRSSQFDRDLAAGLAEKPRGDYTAQPNTPAVSQVSLYFGSDKIGDATATQDQIAQMVRYADVRASR